jgi:hypothetical protein
LTESALWAGALTWWTIQSLGQSSGIFLPTKLFLCLNSSAQQ